MNIFVLDKNPMKAAEYHCDKHCVKMILESAQMLVSAYYANLGIARNKDKKGKEELIAKTFKDFPRKHENGEIHPYGVGYFYHPCTQWSRQTIDNWYWLMMLALELCYEYTRRYGKIHKVQFVLEWMANNPPKLPNGTLTKFVQAMPEDVQHPNAVKAYRMYYNKYKTEFAKWQYSKTPRWYKPIKGK